MREKYFTNRNCRIIVLIGQVFFGDSRVRDRIVLPILFLLLTLSNRIYSAIEAKKISFSELFELKETISIIGDSSAEIFTVWRPLVTEDKIYICDYVNNHVLIYDKSGMLTATFGRKGQGPGEFKMPYSVALDSRGNLYVNDRGNGRVQVFDSNLRFIKIISLPGQNERIFLREKDDKPNIVVVGATGCSKGSCLLQEYDWTGKRIKEFAQYEKDFIIYSWAANMDDAGNIYLVNILEQDLKVFDAEGQLSRTIKLTSPSMRFLKMDLSREPKTMTEMRARSKALNEKEHTRVREVFANKDFVFIFLQLISKKLPKFILDIYDTKGNLLFYGIEIPGLLHCVTDKFYFVKYDEESKYGGMELKGYLFKPKSK